MKKAHTTRLQADLVTPEVIRRAVDDQLHTFLNGYTEEAADLGADYGSLMAEVRTLVSRGGKRTRPLLTVWSYAGFGGTDGASIIRVGASQELFHAGILMHDDIIDRDTTRWNGPNISGVYTSKLQTVYKGRRVREAADSYALMAGDGCIDLSYQQFLASGFPATVLLEGLRLMHRTFFMMLGGEVLDTAAPEKSLQSIPAEDLHAIYAYKTGAYSFGMPLEIGGLLAGAQPKARQKLRQLGTQLGIAYQLQDDVLGLFGDSATTGKPVLSDLREGKRTLLMQYAFQHSDSKGKKLIDRWLGNPAADLAALERVQALLEGTGARQYVQDMAETYYQQAEAMIAAVGWQPAYETRIRHFIHRLLGRQA